MVIDTLELNIVVDNKGTTAKINNTEKALKKLRDVIYDINGAGGVDGAVNGGGGIGSSSRGGSSRSSGSKSASSLMKNLNFGSMVAKLYFVRNITKQLGQNLAKVVQYGIDYEETLNLWQVAMKGNISQARTFVSEMRNAYGIASATLMNYQATFKNMLSALDGLNEDVAYGLSEALTGMALDYASLYNTSIESAMTKFQAVLAGQVRPIRSESGYDITESTIFGIYQQLGGTKSVRQLDQMEKRLLRILAVYKQMQDTATGDLSKTITSSANQLRVMKEQAQEFATWIGVGFNTLLEKSGILVEINAYLYALSALAEQFAISLGYVEKDYSIKEPIEEANTALDNANDKVDELKGKLLGFDKFQVLSNADTGTDTDNVDLSAEILKAIQEYERIINNAENPAFKRSLELLQAWGLELDENGKIIGGFDKVKDRVADIAKGLGGLLVFIGLVTKPWIVFLAALEATYLTNEDFRNSVNKAISSIGSAGLSVMQSFTKLFISLAPALTTTVEIISNVITILDKLGLLETTIWLVVGALLAWKAVQITVEIAKTATTLMPLIKQLKLSEDRIVSMASATAYALVGVSLLASAFMDLQNWGDMSGLEKVSTVLKIVAGAAFLAATAIAAFHTSWSVGVAAGAIAVGVAAIVASMAAAQAAAKEAQASIEMHANGGVATKGSLFVAGEAGPELVTKTSGGNSTIMNMQQLNEAVRLGFVGGLKSAEFLKFANELFDRLSRISAFSAITKKKGIFGFANGGLADRGSLFYAGEAGPELVTQTSGGGSTIMNMQQLEDAVARGFIRGFAATDDGYDSGDTTEVYVDGQRLFNIIRGTARRSGYDFVKV